MDIYIAGPMRGIENLNQKAFLEAADILRAAGHEVFSPVEHAMAAGKDLSAGEPDLDGESRRKGLHADLTYICFYSEAVVFLPGWEKSMGAQAERATAVALGVPVYELHDFIAEGK